VFAAALVAWVVAFLGDRAVEGITRVVRGSPEYQALQEALTVAIGSLLADVPEESREALDNALRECFSAPPSVVKDGRTRVRTGIIRAIQAQLEPLADPAITPSGKSFFDEIGVDGALLRDEVADIVIRSIEQVGPGHPALTPLLTQLNADALAEQVDAVLDGIASLQALAAAPARPDPRDGGWRVSTESRGRQLAAAERSADIAERLTRALLDVPAVAEPESRSMVISLLPSKLKEAIPYSRFPRIHVLGMITASENQANGLRSLIRAVRIAEGDTDAMDRLDRLIVDLESDTDEPGGQQ
jgi:Effector-associated domain 2